MDALKKDPKNSFAYFVLAYIMSVTNYEQTYITLPDGRIFTEKELYIQSINYDITNPYPYINLAHILECTSDENVTLINGCVMNATQLKIEGLKYSSEHHFWDVRPLLFDIVKPWTPQKHSLKLYEKNSAQQLLIF